MGAGNDGYKVPDILNKEDKSGKARGDDSLYGGGGNNIT